MHLVAIGGSDAGISAALRARELDPTTEVTVVVADAYPNFSICGIPYYVSGEVTHWRNLAHRTLDDLEATGMQVRLNTLATKIDVAGRRLPWSTRPGSRIRSPTTSWSSAPGAVSVRPPIEGLVGPEALGPADGVHLLHSMGDTFELMRTLEEDQPASAVIVGAGYIGLEMAEGLTARGLSVTQFEQLPEVLPTVDPSLGALVNAELTRARRGRADRHDGEADRRAPGGLGRPLPGRRRRAPAPSCTAFADMVLVVVGVRPDTALAVAAGAELGIGGAISVDRRMRTNLERVFAAGDCVVTHHRLLGLTYLPLGTTAHKQGRVAGENALGGNREFAGSLGTQVVKIFDMVAARTGSARPRGDRRRLRPGHRRVRGRRPQGLLPRQPPDPHALHRRPHDRAAPRRPALRPPPRRGGQAHRHRGRRHLQRDDRGRHERARPLLHPAPRESVGRRADGGAGLGASAGGGDG